MAQTRPTTTTDGAKALAREFTSLKRRVRDLELRPDPASGGTGGDTFLRVTWCGGAGVEADFNNAESTFDKLLTFEDPTTVEQSGGFVFSDHPDAASIDWDIPDTVGPNHHLHRIQVPESGLYTVVVNYQLRVSWTGADVPYTFVNTTVQPDGIFAGSFYCWRLTDGTMSSGFMTAASFTVELHDDTPFWIEAHAFGRNADGTSSSADQFLTRVQDASLTVEKST